MPETYVPEQDGDIYACRWCGSIYIRYPDAEEHEKVCKTEERDS